MSESSGTTIDDSVGALDGTTFGATWDADAPTFGELDSSGSTAKPQHPMSQQVIG
jgi:hypothetical protein